jgi:hypothetical protein
LRENKAVLLALKYDEQTGLTSTISAAAVTAYEGALSKALLSTETLDGFARANGLKGININAPASKTLPHPISRPECYSTEANASIASP